MVEEEAEALQEDEVVEEILEAIDAPIEAVAAAETVETEVRKTPNSPVHKFAPNKPTHTMNLNELKALRAKHYEEHVALVAGSAFGAEGHVRMSFAASEEKLTDGLDRIARFLKG